MLAVCWNLCFWFLTRHITIVMEFSLRLVHIQTEKTVKYKSQDITTFWDKILQKENFHGDRLTVEIRHVIGQCGVLEDFQQNLSQIPLHNGFAFCNLVHWHSCGVLRVMPLKWMRSRQSDNVSLTTASAIQCRLLKKYICLHVFISKRQENSYVFLKLTRKWMCWL